MLYPLLVVLLAYGLLVLFLVQVAPQLQEAFDSFRVPRHPLLSTLVGLGRSVDTWGPIVPVVVVVAAVIWWWQSGRAILVQAGYAGTLLGWFPWVGPMLRWSRGAMFAETFALLLEHDVPLDEAVLLAAEAAGDARAVEAARQMSQAIRRGEPAAVRVAGISPIMAWLIECRPEQRVLLSAARSAAQSFSWWAAHRAEIVRMLLPILLVAVMGGLVTAFYAIALFVPWSNLLRSLN
jgi:type II secretory pathway component PulF